MAIESPRTTRAIPNRVVVGNVKIYDWLDNPRDASWFRDTDEGGIFSTGQVYVDQPDSSGDPLFVDPSRFFEDYVRSELDVGSTGKEFAYEKFRTSLLNRPLGTMPAGLTATAVNTYLRPDFSTT